MGFRSNSHERRTVMLRRFLSLSLGALVLLVVLAAPGQLQAQRMRGMVPRQAQRMRGMVPRMVHPGFRNTLRPGFPGRFNPGFNRGSFRPGFTPGTFRPGFAPGFTPG